MYNCRFGLVGFSNQSRGFVFNAPATPENIPYGYLFYNCSFFYNRENTTGAAGFGRPWRRYGQLAFINTDVSNVSIDSNVWGVMGGIEGNGHLSAYNNQKSCLINEQFDWDENDLPSPWGAICYLVLLRYIVKERVGTNESRSD